jgi:anthranilate synthase component 1
VVVEAEEGVVERLRVRDPLDFLARLVPGRPGLGGPRLLGGFVGFVGYDYVRCLERLPARHRDSGDYLVMGLFLDGVVYDHRAGRAYYYSFSEDRCREKLKGLSEGEMDYSYSPPKVNIPQAEFESMVRRAKEYIAAGDIFQVVLSKRYEFQARGEPLGFYARLRELNPSPYMFYLKFGESRVVGASPEMLVRVEGRRVETFPIAGTRRLTGDPQLDDRLAEELLADEKERAEHLMLVDLARNDLGRVCDYASVSVPEFMVVERYSHVQHLVSRVVGHLRADATQYDALRALFPAGTVTGAPKVRAMEIIEELEPCSRGPYAGAVGYFSLNGNMDFAITIRTLIQECGWAYIQAGAGIVADSRPDREWYETEQKAAALLEALRGGG